MYHLETEKPFEATGGWVVDLATRGEDFSVFVHWAPLEARSEDHWVCQVSQRKSLLGRLFGQANSPLIQELCESLEAVVRELDDISNLRWLSEEELRKLY